MVISDLSLLCTSTMKKIKQGRRKYKCTVGKDKEHKKCNGGALLGAERDKEEGSKGRGLLRARP